jgi:hypothetical protein
MNKLLLALILGLLLCSALSFKVSKKSHQFLRLQYGPGEASPKSEYYGECNPSEANIPETCSEDKAIERNWKRALYCGWFNGYSPYTIAIQTLGVVKNYVDKHEGEHNMDTVTCILTTTLYKNGIHQCQIYYDNLFVLYLNDFELTHSKEELEQAAFNAVNLRFENFDVERDCPDNMFRPYHDSVDDSSE